MPAFTTGKSILGADGVLYALTALMPSAEGDVFNGVGQDPVSIPYHEAIAATVLFQVQGGPLITNSSYVVLQTDMGDSNWIDVAGCGFTALNGTSLFLLSAGVAGALSLQQTRTVGATPTPVNFSNQMCLGGRIRFVGKSSNTGTLISSSPGPTVIPGVNVTIRYKLLGLR